MQNESLIYGNPSIMALMGYVDAWMECELLTEQIMELGRS